MAPYVHRVFSQKEYEVILSYFQGKVEELYAVYGYSDFFVNRVMDMVKDEGDVPGLKEWAVNFLQEKREAKELQEREERMAYAIQQPMAYAGQDAIGLLEKIHELLKDLVSRASRLLPSTPKKAKTFKMLLQGDNKADILRRLHASIDGKSGKAVAMVLLKALKEKMISRLPSELEFCTEFKLRGTWKAISFYLNPNTTIDITSIVI